MKVFAVLPFVVIAAMACSSSDSEPTPATGGSGGSTGGSGGSATGGAAGSSTGGSATGGAAGNARTQAAALARDDIPCVQDADCCVVFDMCQNTGYVVASGDNTATSTLLSGAPQDGCTNCIPPAIQVSCGANGFCTGVKVECVGSMFQEGMQDHCGALTLPAECAVVPPKAPPISGGYIPHVILGCGN